MTTGKTTHLKMTARQMHEQTKRWSVSFIHCYDVCELVQEVEDVTRSQTEAGRDEEESYCSH